MDLRDYLSVLRTRWRLVALCTLLGIGAAAAATFLATPVYQARAQVFVSTAAGDTVTGLQQGGQFAQQRVKSYADIVDSPPVTQAVIERLGLELTPIELREKISAAAPLDTVLINIDVDDESPIVAADLANAVAFRFTEVATELETPQDGAPSPVKVSVVRPADLPETPVSPRPLLNMALGLLVGLGVGIAAAVLRETLDTTVKNTGMVQEVTGLPTIGATVYDADAPKRPLIVHVDPRSPRAEAFRQLRTNLQFVDVDRRPRSIVVTSSLPQEGKTTTTCNLAIALAQAGVRVVLVDADLRRPRIHDYMGVVGVAGLTDALVGRASVDDLLQPWGDGNLMVLPSGRVPPNPSEMLGSEQMRQVLASLESRADLVLLDAPPLLPVTDAAVLATFASGALVVVRAGKTKREQAGRTVDILRGVDAHLYGVVLTMLPAKGSGGYDYGYGYGYAPHAGADSGTGRPGGLPAWDTEVPSGQGSTVVPEGVTGRR
jgi:polysaccharide biosynthesis transport protein